MRPLMNLAAILSLFAMAGPVNATIVNFTLDRETSGSGSVLSAPVIVTLDDENTPGTVEITIDMSALMAAEFMTGLYLNFDPAKDPVGMTLTDTGAVASVGISSGIDCCKPNGQGQHDVQIDFPAANAQRFNGGEIYTGTLSLVGLAAVDFAFLSSTGNCAVARVQGLGDGGEGSGWFDCAGEQKIPEPGSLALLGLGAGLIGMFGRRRRFG